MNNLTAFFEETLSFVWLKVSIFFFLYLRKVSIIKYILYKNIKTECGEPFYNRFFHVCVMLILFRNTFIGFFV